MQPIGEPVSLFASESLVETRYSTQKHQEQGTAALETAYSGMHSVLLMLPASSLHTDDIPIKYIDPRLLSITHRTHNASLVTCHTSTLGTQFDLGLFSPPTASPPAYPNYNHTVATPTDRHTPPLTPGAPAHITTHGSRPAASHGTKRVRHQASSPYHKKRRAKALETLIQQPFYHSLPAADQEYFDRVVTSLRGATHLTAPQVLEPTVGSLAGLELVGPRRSTGPGTAANRESVYAILVDRPEEGAYVCWLCGEMRADRRLPRALDHVRGHFSHRPYHCLEDHSDQHTGSGSSLPLASVW